MLKSFNTTKTKNNLAMTLSEVLITLGIIGVIAALVIPIIQNNLQKGLFKNHRSI